MEWLVNFLFNWQQLIGALLGALIAIGGSIGLSSYLTKKAERKRQYANLLLVLQDLESFISKCENYFNSQNQNLVSFSNIILNDKIDYISSSQVFDLDSKVYSSIHYIYNVAQVIRYNLENSEAITTSIAKKNNIKIDSPEHIRLMSKLTKTKIKTGDIEIHTQENVLSGRYNRALILARYYLREVYRNFNIIAREIKKLPKKYKYLSFPENIKLYKKDYVEQKNIEYGLDKVI